MAPSAGKIQKCIHRSFGRINVVKVFDLPSRPSRLRWLLHPAPAPPNRIKSIRYSAATPVQSADHRAHPKPARIVATIIEPDIRFSQQGICQKIQPLRFRIKNEFRLQRYQQTSGLPPAPRSHPRQNKDRFTPDAGSKEPASLRYPLQARDLRDARSSLRLRWPRRA